MFVVFECVDLADMLSLWCCNPVTKYVLYLLLGIHFLASVALNYNHFSIFFFSAGSGARAGDDVKKNNKHGGNLSASGAVNSDLGLLNQQLSRVVNDIYRSLKPTRRTFQTVPPLPRPPAKRRLMQMPQFRSSQISILSDMPDRNLIACVGDVHSEERPTLKTTLGDFKVTPSMGPGAAPLSQALVSGS